MALFKRSREESGSDEAAGELAPVEALAGIAVSAVYADGVLSADEDAELGAYLSRMRVFRGLSDREVDAALRKVHEAAARDGDEALVGEACKALPVALRPTAFLLAADLLMSDGEFGDEERRFLRGLQDRLDLDSEMTAQIHAVLEIKHRTGDE